MASSGDTKEPMGRRGSNESMNLLPPVLSLRRLVLVGLTGVGKSSSGNTILGRDAFRAAKKASSVTKECSKETENVFEREITVVDTPGMFDTDTSDDYLLRKISKCINMTAPGPHAIVLVIRLGAFTEEEKLSVEKIRAIFGEKSDTHTIILFTHGDKLTGNIEERISEAGKDLKEILERCEGRYHVFNNKDKEDRKQVLEFLKKVDAMVAANEGEYYVSDFYQDEELVQKMKHLTLEYEKKTKELESKYAEENQKLKEEINEIRQYYEGQLREARLQLEQTPNHENKIKKIFDKIKGLYKVKL